MLIKGNIIHTMTKDAFEILRNGYIYIKNERIEEIGKDLNEKYPDEKVEDYTNQLIIPSFTDLHFHAVQYGNLGIGLDEQLLDWLNHYTFKEERKFEDLDYAEVVFRAALEHVIQSGTTRIVFFSSIHEKATKLLMDLCEAYHITAFVGKVNMDRNAPEYLLEETESSYQGTLRLLEHSEHVKGIITPRFVPSCTINLMEKLGSLASLGYPVQTHISENLNEIDWVKSLHPEYEDYLSVYDACQLIGPKTILAHCVYCTDQEIKRIKETGAFVAHCPTANLNLTSGIMDVKKYLDEGIQIGFGTDVGAGQTPSIRQVMVHAIQVSKVNQMKYPERKRISFSEAFYMATKGGGQYFGKSGSFEKGYSADFLVIKKDPLCEIRKMTLIEELQRFIYAGDNQKIDKVYNRGRLLHSNH
ncbi:MAG: amidohydrolase family protein [Clostridia bacterium]|nr:amidohydrolase family protein [Clostridia bacterium]